MRLNRIKIGIILFIIIYANIYSANLQEDIKKANSLYKNGKFEMAEILVSRIIDTYPSYENALVLQYKIFYETDKNINEKIYTSLSEASKKSIFNFLIEKKDSINSELFLKEIINKDKLVKIYLDLLYEQKKYKKIADEYGNQIGYIKKIEDDKKKSEQEYFEAIDLVKNGEIDKSINLLNSAINRYPFNYRYYLKLGQLYADKRNYFLAEYHLKKALGLSEEKAIYLNLFYLYDRYEKTEDLYSIAGKIMDVPDVRKKLRKLYIESEISKQKVQILKIEDNKIYIRSNFIKDINIGDSYYIGITDETIRDLTTGEELMSSREKFAKVRVFSKEEKLVILHILQRYKKLEINKKYNLF